MTGTEQSLRTRALVAAGKQVAHARGQDGTWHLEVFVDAILAVTEADKAEAVAAAVEGAARWIELYAVDGNDPVSVLLAAAARLRRLAAEVGITVDTTTEEKL